MSDKHIMSEPNVGFIHATSLKLHPQWTVCNDPKPNNLCWFICLCCGYFFFLSQVILFLFSFVTGMVMYANEDETKQEKYKLPEIN